MKRIILSLFLALTCVSAHAATWYIRTDGGTATQCTGHTDAAYPGSGNAQACAVNHPFWLLDQGSWTWRTDFKGGDTIQFGDVGPYYMGQALNGLGQNWAHCGTNGKDCVLPAGIPSGTSTNPTRILGKNAGSCHNASHTGLTNPTVLSALNGLFWVVSLQNTNWVDMECIDITQPDTCTLTGPGTGTIVATQMVSGTATYSWSTPANYGNPPVINQTLNITGTTNGGGVFNVTNKPVASKTLSAYRITGSQMTSGTATFTYTLVSGPLPQNGQGVTISGTTNGGGAFNQSYGPAISNVTATTFQIGGYSGSPTYAYQAESGTSTNLNSGSFTITGLSGTYSAQAETGTEVQTGTCVYGTNNYGTTGVVLAYGDAQGPANATLHDIGVHGMAANGVLGSHLNLTPSDIFTASDIYIAGNGEVGWDSDGGGCGTNCESQGTMNFNYISSMWNGCNEVKPNGGTVGGNGYNYCVDQAYNGNGDGLVMIATGGTWNWDHVVTKWNMQDGFDSLHVGDDLANLPDLNMNNIYSEGNEGQSIKGGGKNVTLTNSIGIGNCWVMQTASNFPNNPNGWNAMLGMPCRANDAFAFAMADGDTLNVFNTTNVNEHDTSVDIAAAGSGNCTGNCIIHFENNVTMGFDGPASGRLPGGMYIGVAVDPFKNQASTINHNSWWHMRSGTCPQSPPYETNAVCTDPQFVAQANINAMNVHLTSGSPLRGAGITLPGLTADFAGLLRSGASSIGALEFSSAPPTQNQSQLSLSVTPASLALLQPVTLTGSVAAVGGVVPTGSVAFYAAGGMLGSAPLNSTGVASYTTSSLAVGVYAVTATYAGDNNYSSAASISVSLKVNLPEVGLPPSETGGGPPVTGEPPPETGGGPPVTGEPPPVTTKPPPVTGSPPPVTEADPPAVGGKPTAVSIAVAQPEYGFNVIPGSTRRIFATVTNGSTNQVAWTVKSGSAQISSNSGAWIDVTAPATGSSCSVTGTSAQYKVTSATQFTIEAASVDDGSKTANVTFNVCKPGVEVSIVPFYRTLYANQPADVQSLVLGSVNQNVHWTVTSQPKNGDGRLTDSTSRDTLFTGTIPGRYELTATSVADAGKSATAIMYVTGHAMPYRVTPNETVPVDCTVDPSMLGTVYEVGPSQTFKSLTSVPFPTMVPGSTVRLHNEDTTGLHPTEYHEYVQISQPATADQPFRMCGVPDSMGNLPIVDGLNATGRSDISADVVGAALLTLHKSNYFTYWPQFSAAQYIAVEGIQFRNAKAGNSYSPPSGSAKTWQASSSCIRINQGQNIAFVGDDIGSCSNGVVSEFNSNGGWGASDVNVLWDGNHIHNNGIAGSKLGHQMYLQSWGNIVQFNRIDNYTAGALGANIKSRGLQDVIRYNYLGDGAQRQLDLVDVTDAPAYMSFSGFLSGGAKSFHSLYSKDNYPADRIAAEQEAWNSHFVYGNIYQNSTSSAPIHFSMDTNGGELARKGSLYWYNNTFYEKACATCASPWTLFDTSGGNGTYYPQTEFQTVQAYNNIVWMGNTAKPAFQWNNYAAFIGIGSSNLLPANWGTNSADGGVGSGWNTSPNAKAYQNSLPLTTHVTGFDKADILTTSSIPFDQNSWILSSKVAGTQLVPSAVCSMPTRFAYLPNLGYAVPRIDAPGVGATDTVAETATLMNAVAGTGRYNTRYSNCH